MLLNPIIAMLHNTENDRWHPVVFEEKPLPGNNPDAPVRHKSKMHHTEGFATRDEALVNCDELAGHLKNHAIGEIKVSVEKAFPWDGEDIPAIVVFFSDDEVPVPLIA